MIRPGSKLAFTLVELALLDPLDDPAGPDTDRVQVYQRLLDGQPAAHLGLLIVEPSDKVGRFKLLDGHHRWQAYRMAGRRWVAVVVVEEPGGTRIAECPGWIVPAGT